MSSLNHKPPISICFPNLRATLSPKNPSTGSDRSPTGNSASPNPSPIMINTTHSTRPSGSGSSRPPVQTGPCFGVHVPTHSGTFTGIHGTYLE